MKDIIQNNKKNIKSIIKKITGYTNEDIEQEVYIKIWNKLKDNKQISKISQWINTITANTCKDFLKSKQYKSDKLTIDSDETTENITDRKTPDNIVDSLQRQKIILKAVNKLPKKMKEVIILYEFEEQSYDEISKKLKIPVGTVKSRIFNAREILKNTLSELIGD